MDFRDIVTVDAGMKTVLRTAEKVALSNVNLLLTGESGTGKNVLSKAIHDASQRRGGPFVAVNCMAMPDTLVASELFGHEKGAFTDARAAKRGSFEMADHGTLYLDEIGDIPAASQGKILQAIETKQIKRLGSEKPIETDVRIISATHRDLKKRIEEGGFREDLYYRLREISLHLPSLRERREDIPFLVRYFIKMCCCEVGKAELKISDVALRYLTEYPWPGNIRELKNVIKSAVVLCNRETLWLEHFPFEIQLKGPGGATGAGAADFSIDAILKRHIQAALEHFDWNKRKAATALGISRPRLDRYLQKYHLERIEN